MSARECYTGAALAIFAANRARLKHKHTRNNLVRTPLLVSNAESHNDTHNVHGTHARGLHHYHGRLVQKLPTRAVNGAKAFANYTGLPRGRRELAESSSPEP